MGADPLAGDILNPQLLNRFVYFVNDPVNRIDPLGLEDFPCNQADVIGGTCNHIVDITVTANGDRPGGGGVSGAGGGGPAYGDFGDLIYARRPGGGSLGGTYTKSGQIPFEPGTWGYNTFGPPSARIWNGASQIANATLVGTAIVPVVPAALRRQFGGSLFRQPRQG